MAENTEFKFTLENTGFEFSRSDIEKLAEELDEVKLSDRSQAILVAIFAAARHQVSVREKGPEMPTGASLRRELVDAFIPVRAQTNFFLFQPDEIGRISSGGSGGPGIHIGGPGQSEATTER